jgi:hypothetical protein
VTPAVALTEKQWQAQVTDLAKVYRWAVYHTQISKWSEAGWPDLALCRPPRLILAELKSDKGKTTEGQRYWLNLLDGCPGVETHLWRPADFDAVCQALR